MTSQEIADYINHDLLAGTADANVTPETELVLSGLLDSIALMRLVAHLEKSTGSKIPQDGLVMENFANPSTLAGYLDRLG